MGGTKRKQRLSKSLGNLGDESQGDGRRREAGFGKEAGREVSGPQTYNRFFASRVGEGSRDRGQGI